jgi:hypothetical protein
VRPQKAVTDAASEPPVHHMPKATDEEADLPDGPRALERDSDRDYQGLRGDPDS